MSQRLRRNDYDEDFRAPLESRFSSSSLFLYLFDCTARPVYSHSHTYTLRHLDAATHWLCRRLTARSLCLLVADYMAGLALLHFNCRYGVFGLPRERGRENRTAFGGPESEQNQSFEQSQAAIQHAFLQLVRRALCSKSIKCYKVREC